ncbi:NAD(P)-binding protein [Schizopora paradoxa]|uniref:NAD(P)-binding protein n=1 Tax=Schizopora paradoxa TaxID=27342 RepID=A0A0H2RW27_9AGAM|nr:NAD(P)-binding protein [Schizopora paradoxa]
MSMTNVQEKAFASCSQYAFVGASSNPTKFGNKLFEAYKAAGLKVIPVNPNEKSVDGIPCLKSIQDLPSPSTTGVVIVTQPSVTLDVLKTASSMGTIPIIFVQPGASDQSVADFVSSNKIGDKVLLEAQPRSQAQAPTQAHAGTEKMQKPNLSPIDTKTVLPASLNLRKSAVTVGKHTTSSPHTSTGSHAPTPSTAVAPSTPLTAGGQPLISSPIISNPVSTTPASSRAGPGSKQSSTPLSPRASLNPTPEFSGVPCSGIKILHILTERMANTTGSVKSALTSPVAKSPSVLHQLSQGVENGMKSLSLRHA